MEEGKRKANSYKNLKRGNFFVTLILFLICKFIHICSLCLYCLVIDGKVFLFFYFFDGLKYWEVLLRYLRLGSLGMRREISDILRDLGVVLEIRHAFFWNQKFPSFYNRQNHTYRDVYNGTQNSVFLDDPLVKILHYLGAELTDFDSKTRFGKVIKFYYEVLITKTWYGNIIVVYGGSKVARRWNFSNLSQMFHS